MKSLNAISESEIDRINLRTMRSSNVVSEYSARADQLRHEQAALGMVALECRGESILELGVGGGRAVNPLLDISSDYHGIDYSPEMIAACRRRFPHVKFTVADARNLAGVVADASIKLVVFTCNGISMVGHDDRLLILREAFRVLKPNGLIVFSTYDRHCPEASIGYRWPRFTFTPNPVRLSVRTARFALRSANSLINRLRYRRHEVHTPHYAMINDTCHDHGVMLYYITVTEQCRQLENLGYSSEVRVLDAEGNPMLQTGRFDSMALIARKPAHPLPSIASCE